MSNSVHLIIGQKENLIPSAVISATNVKSTDAYRRDSVSRIGNGRVSLSGDSDVENSAIVDIEIQPGISGDSKTSLPVYKGIGSSELTDLVANPASNPASYLIRLVDKGVRERVASLTVDGYELTISDPGADGNNYYIDVDDSDIIRTPINFSLIEALENGVNSNTGEEWDWDSAVGESNVVPATAKRVSIGDDLSVYRQWKTFENRKWKYKIYPETTKSYGSGSQIYEVTGEYSIILTNGVASETFTGKTTRDILLDIDANSAIATVTEIPSAETTVDNEAAYADFPIRTKSRVNYTDGSGSGYATGFINHYAGGAASTEIIEARCFSNSTSQNSGVGKERWSVRGSVSGILGDAVTGVAYSSGGRFGFTIPTMFPDGYDEPKGSIDFNIDYITRSEEDALPPDICIDEMHLGSNAVSKKVTFRYMERPGVNCPCDGVQYTALTNLSGCLDIEKAERSIMSNSLATTYASRLQKAMRYHKDFVGGNTELSANGDITVSEYDIDLANKAYGSASDTLARIHGEGTLEFDAWQASTAVAVDDVIEDSGNKFVCSVAGTTGGTPPAFVTSVIGDTTVDGGATWEYVSDTPLAEWDSFLEGIKSDLSVIELLGTTDSIEEWDYVTTYALDDYCRQIYQQIPYTGVPVPNPVGNSKLFRCLAGGTTGARPSQGATWQYLYYPNEAQAVGQIVGDSSNPVMSWVYLGEAFLASNSAITSQPDGSSGFRFDIDAYMSKYVSMANHVLSTAEIVPNIDDANITGKEPGGDCWRDPGDSHYWKADGYLPMFSNWEYASVRRKSDGSEAVVPTREFSFVAKIGCVERLMVGDSITVNISDVGQAVSYQVGDKLRLSLTAGLPLNFIGGINGNDILKWNVFSENGNGEYQQDLTSPALYDDGHVQFRIVAGGIDNEVNDEYSYCVENNTFKWRMDGGAWSAEESLGDVVIDNNITVSFESGQCPNFVANDIASFTVLQQNGILNIADPSEPAYRFDGSDTSIELRITGTIGVLMIAMHTLPEGCSINISDLGSLNEAIEWNDGPIVHQLASPLTDPILTIAITSAEGAKIGWIWAGIPFNIYPLAESQTRFERFYMNEGINYGQYNAIGRGANMSWNGFISKDELIRLRGIVHYAKANDNTPLCILGNKGEPDQAFLAKAPNEIRWNEFSDFHDPNPNGGLNNQNIRLNMEFVPWRF